MTGGPETSSLPLHKTPAQSAAANSPQPPLNLHCMRILIVKAGVVNACYIVCDPIIFLSKNVIVLIGK